MRLVGVVGIELKAALKTRKLLILLNGKNAKNTGFAQPRYTRGTRKPENQGIAEANYFRGTRAHLRLRLFQLGHRG
jgi:hypothetical protein